MRLSIADRDKVERRLKELQQDSFYHYFPLLLAISERSKRMEVDSEGNVWVGDGELYFEGTPSAMSKARRVWVSQNKPPMGWRFEVYDVNYVYELKTTLQVKNFRDNVKRFERDNPKVRVAPFERGEALNLLEEWYSAGKRREYSDFGYTLYLVEHFEDFGDLEGFLVYLDCDTVGGLSVWGRLGPDTAIHLVCKTRSDPFLHDFTRYKTYEVMADKGFKYVNDGSDVGIPGIRIYKTKLRPWLIYPVWSWFR